MTKARCACLTHEGVREVEEVCRDGYCRACHVSLSFEACIDDSWSNEQRANAGLPPMPSGERK